MENFLLIFIIGFFVLSISILFMAMLMAGKRTDEFIEKQNELMRMALDRANSKKGPNAKQ